MCALHAAVPDFAAEPAAEPVELPAEHIWHGRVFAEKESRVREKPVCTHNYVLQAAVGHCFRHMYHLSYRNNMFY